MPEFANLIELHSSQRDFRIKIDGQEFPWYVSHVQAGPTEPNMFPFVTLKIEANRVEVVHDVAKDMGTS